MKIVYGCMLLLCISLAACSNRNSGGVGMSISAPGVGLALFASGCGVGAGAFTGITVSIDHNPNGYDEGGYSSGRIVRRIPRGSRPNSPYWYEEYEALSPLAAYRAFQGTR